MKPLIVIAGPTAVGKSDLAIRLAKTIGGSIMSADSMQVYRGMDIGSAKIKSEEMDRIPHYLINCIRPDQAWNVTIFQERAREAMGEIYACGRIPILVGGTGFYIQALTRDICFTPVREDPEFRREMELLAREEGEKALHDRLSLVDPEAAAQIHAHNVKRVIRALEFYHTSGQRISDHNARERGKKSPYQLAYLVLTQDRQTLYDRIDRRVDRMMEEGLLEEVMALKRAGYHRGMVSMHGLGYKELLSYLDGQISLDQAVYEIKRDTRHFAKRQLTWFKREEDSIWIDKSRLGNDEDIVLDRVLEILRERDIYGSDARDVR